MPLPKRSFTVDSSSGPIAIASGFQNEIEVLSVPADRRIIKRSTVEVNAMSGESDQVFLCKLARTLKVLLMVAVVTSVSCGKEQQAERLYREASRAIEEDDLDKGVELLERIPREYPGTEAAGRARDDARLYRGLAGAVRQYPVRVAKDRMIRTARALDRYHRRRRSFPESLSVLVPDYLDVEPTDPWNRDFIYRTRSGGKGYVLVCHGADRKPGGIGVEGDLRIEDGEFVQERGESEP